MVPSPLPDSGSSSSAHRSFHMAMLRKGIRANRQSVSLHAVMGDHLSIDDSFLFSVYARNSLNFCPESRVMAVPCAAP